MVSETGLEDMMKGKKYRARVNQNPVLRRIAMHGHCVIVGIPALKLIDVRG